MTYSEVTPEFQAPADSTAEPVEPTQDAGEDTESDVDNGHEDTADDGE